MSKGDFFERYVACTNSYFMSICPPFLHLMLVLSLPHTVVSLRMNQFCLAVQIILSQNTRLSKFLSKLYATY